MNSSLKLLLHLILINYNETLNALLKSGIHVPTYAGLLSVNVTFLLLIVTKSLSKIFVTYSLVLMSFLIRNFCCLQALHQFSLLSFPLLYHMQHCSLVCTALFPSLSLFFSASVIVLLVNFNI